MPPLTGDQCQDLFCKGNDHAAGKGEKAIGALAGIMGLERKTHLNNAPAEQDKAYCTDNPENEIGEIVDDGQRIIGYFFSEDRNG